MANYLAEQPHTDDTENNEDKDDADFDLAVVGLGFHHFHNPAHALTMLKGRLKKGGVLGIVDFLPFPAGGHSHHHLHHHGHGEHNQHNEHNDKHAEHKRKKDEKSDGAFPEEALPTIKTSGFSEEDMKRLFEGAGLGDVSFVVMDGEVEMFVGQEERRVVRRVFVASGVGA